MSSSAGGMDIYLDEEQALGFHVWVAELELLVGTAKGRSVDQVAAFELLQKVLVTIDTTDVGVVREYQRRCELALLDILLKGPAPPVRRLICECMARLYTVGDMLPLYSRASGLVSLLTGKEARGLTAPVRLGALQCLATLCEKHGRPLASSMSETLAVALKHAGRGAEPAVRAAALELVANVVAGLGGSDRSSPQVQLDALKCAIKAARDADDSSGRLAAASIIRAVAQAGGAALWGNLSWYNEAIKLCVGFLDTEDGTIADAFAGILGHMAAASRSEAAASAVKALQKKPSRQATLQQALKDATRLLLVSPFVEAAVHARWPACKALTQAWLAYFAHVQEAGEGDTELVGVAAMALEMLAVVSARAQPSAEEGEAELGAPLSSGEIPTAQACVLYAVRVGVIERLGEAGQHAMLERLAALLDSEAAARPPLAVAALEAAGLLLEVLGEISSEQVAALEQPIAAKLVAPSSCVRRQAAGLLAALASAEPASAARLLRHRLQALSRAAAAATDRLGTEPKEVPKEGELQGSPKGLFSTEAAELKPCLDAVHGNALGAAALLVAAARLPLGVPSKLLLEALSLSERLINSPACKRAAGRAAERQAGYVVLGALPLSLPSERLLAERQRLVQLWQAALAAESAAELDLRRYLTISQAQAEVTMSMELWWRAAALEALKALILSPLVTSGTPDAARLQRRLTTILQPTLAVVLASPLLQDPQRAKGVLGGACAVFQLRLLEAYLALPSPAAFASEHQALSKLCSRAFRGSAAQPNSAPDAAAAAAGGTLRMLLNRQDAPLGPWVAGRGPLEDALQAFAGAPGGPPRHPWQAGLPFSTGHPGDVQLEASEPFTQPRSLSAALLERQLVLLGGLLASVSETNQLLILDVLTEAATAPPPKRGARDSPGRRRAVLTSLCCAALAGLDSLARRYRGEAGARDAVAERARALAEAALEEGAALGDGALLRAAAEMFALAACIGSDSHAVSLLRTLCSAMESSAAPSRRACLALALGCVYRSKGGLALQGCVNRTAGSLLAVARSSSGPPLAWLLHALWLLANAAGLALLPHVQEVLALEMELVMSEASAVLPGMRPALARLANALVAVLGPELTPGSSAYSRTRCLLLDLQSLASKATSAEEATMASLERVLYAQMLVLFAPGATPAASHLPLLLATLQSRQPALRRAAADTLRHLAERDPEAMLPARVETVLFAALDGEPDAGIASQLHATLRTLLEAGAPTRPSHTLAVCAAVIFSSAPPTTVEASPSVTLADEDDSDGDEESTARVPPPPPPQQEAAKPAGGTRLRTREFAAKCLTSLPDLVACDPRHLDPNLAKGEGGGDWLVSHLQGLIDAGFNMATGTTEALRPHGLKLLRVILRHFGDAPDPLLEGGRLLEQSQAQFVSALRVALTREAAPKLLAAGALLAADFVESGLAQGDPVLLARLISMMTEPLATMLSQPQEQYSEWVDARARIALLEAHAICAGHLMSSPQARARKILADAQKARPGMLMGQWLALLQDWLVLGYEPSAVQSAYVPRLAAEAAPQNVLPFLRGAWPPVLGAACRLLESGARGAEGIDAVTDTVGYQLLVDVCLAVVYTAGAPGSSSPGAEREVAVALGGLRCLLSTRFLEQAWCTQELCCEAALATGGLIKQAALSGDALQAAGAVIRQICEAAPEHYLSGALAGGLASAILAAIEASSAGSPDKPGCEAAACTALEAAALLLGRANGAVVRPKVLVRAATLLKDSVQVSVVEASTRCLAAAAKAAADKMASVSGPTPHANGATDSPPDSADILAYSAAAASTALTQALPQKDSPTDLSRFGVLLSLVLAIGGLLPTQRGEPLPLLVALEPSLKAAHTEREHASEPAAWSDAGGSQDADSASDSWADDDFQAAEASPAPAVAGELAAEEDSVDANGAWGAEFDGATPGKPPEQSGGGAAEAEEWESPAAPALAAEQPAPPAPPKDADTDEAADTAASASPQAAAVSQEELHEQLEPDSRPSGWEPAALRSASPADDGQAGGGGSSVAHAAASVSDTPAADPSPQPPVAATEIPSAAVAASIGDGFADFEAAGETGSQPHADEQPPTEEGVTVRAGDGSEAEQSSAESSQSAGADFADFETAGETRIQRHADEQPPTVEGVAVRAGNGSEAEQSSAESSQSAEDFAAFEAAEGSPRQPSSEQQSPREVVGPDRDAQGSAAEAQQDNSTDSPPPGAMEPEEASESPQLQSAAGSDDGFADFEAAEEPEVAQGESAHGELEGPSSQQAELLDQEPSSGGSTPVAGVSSRGHPATEGPSMTGRDSERPAHVPEVVVTARQVCLQALAAAVTQEAPAVAQSKAIAAVRALAHEASSQSGSSSATHWAAACAIFVANPASRIVAQQMRESSADELSQEQVLVASETLKLLHSSLAVLAVEDAAAEMRCLGLLVDLLVLCAEPQGAGSAGRLLRELVAKLMTVLASGASGPAFRTALLALPAASREKLQAALKPQGGQPAPATVAGARKPTIALKTFAPLKTSGR